MGRPSTKNKLILAKGQYYNLDCHITRLNNNVIVVGGSGSGKTTSIVEPNIRQAIGSYIVVDCKGILHDKYKEYLEKQGYVVKKLNLIQPDDPESSHYNFFRYIQDDMDVIKIAHLLMTSKPGRRYGLSSDPLLIDAA